MCDCSPGRVILIHDRDDIASLSVVEAVRANEVPNVEYAASMDSVTHAFGQNALHLLKVPPGAELWTANNLQFFYQTEFAQRLASGEINSKSYPYQVFSDANRRMVAAPDSVVDFASAAPGTGFRLSRTHDDYKRLLNVGAASQSGAGVRIAIVDSGLDPASGIVASSESRALHDDSATQNIDDYNGHGTAVVSVIHDIAPGAELTVLKVGEQNPMSEFNLIAAMLSGANADVMNLSIAFSLRARDCKKCGRAQSHSSRSMIFERVLKSMMGENPELIIVAAAGNRGLDRVDYPARYANVVAVGAIDSHLSVAPYSNTGAKDDAENDHDRLYFAPGGSEYEFVGTTTASDGTQTDHEGTSFAAPYVTALIALNLESCGGRSPGAADAALNRLKLRADTSINGYSQDVHGNGLARF